MIRKSGMFIKFKNLLSGEFMTKRFFIWLSILSIYILFHDSITILLATSQLSLWFKLVRQESSTNLVFIIWIVTAAIFYCFRIWRRQLSNSKWLFLLICILTIYFADRFFYRSWQYYPVNYTIKYFDLFVLIGLFELISILANTFGRNKDVNSSILHLVRPIKNSSEDKLNRSIFAERIAYEINRSFFNESYSIAIISEWAGGKSSFLNLIQNSLDPKSKIIIRFQPWLNYSNESLIHNFFQEFKSSLNKYDANIESLFDRYYASISNTESNIATRLLDSFNDVISESSTVGNDFELINQALRRIRRQVIVICDDLDRLDQKEIVEFFKLIRNTANFRNTVYLTAFDRGYVTNAIRQFTKYNPHKFIDKIFDFEYVLPEVNQDYLIDNLNEFLIHELAFNNKLESYSAEISIFRKFITSHRDVERFKQHLRFSFNKASTELVREELFILELLRFRYPQVLSHFYKFNRVYLDWSAIKIINQISYLSLSKSGLKEDVPLLKRHLLQNEIHKNNKYHLSSYDIDTIVDAFVFLFENRKVGGFAYDHIELPLNSLRNADYFHIYFKLIFDNRVLKASEFEDFLKHLNQVEWKKYVESILLMNGVGSKPILIFNYLRTKFPSLISTRLGYENSIFILLKIESIGIPIPKDLFDKFFDFDNRFIKSYFADKLEVKRYFQSLFRNDDFTFHGRSNLIFSYVYKYLKEPSYSFILSKEELEEINSYLFKSYLNTIQEIDNSGMRIFYNNYHDINTENNVVLNTSVIVALKEFILSGKYTGYLNLLIRPASIPNHSYEFVFEPYLFKVFDSYEEFETFLTSLTEYKNRNKLLEYLSKYKENQFMAFELKSDCENGLVPKEFINMFPV